VKRHNEACLMPYFSINSKSDRLFWGRNLSTCTPNIIAIAPHAWL
jgi:hypothetical protein